MTTRHRFVHPAVLTVSLILVASAAAQEMSPAAASIPPDADGAMPSLLESPRHGEWVDVPLDTGVAGETASVRTWIVYPERADAAPVVIVIHEIFGMSDWVRAVADRLAAEGFLAVAPDLLSGLGPGGGGADSFAGDDVRTAIRGLGADEVARRLDAVRTHALALPSASTRSACIGFCWGGSSSFGYATAQPALDAAVVYYGTAPDEREMLARVACPVLGLYGGDDARVTSTVAATAETMADLGKDYERAVYDGAGHGFLRRQDGRDGANLAAATAAWGRTLEFLRAHLEPDAAGDDG